MIDWPALRFRACPGGAVAGQAGARDARHYGAPGGRGGRNAAAGGDVRGGDLLGILRASGQSGGVRGDVARVQPLRRRARERADRGRAGGLVRRLSRIIRRTTEDNVWWPLLWLLPS